MIRLLKFTLAGDSVPLTARLVLAVGTVTDDLDNPMPVGNTLNNYTIISITSIDPDVIKLDLIHVNQNLALSLKIQVLTELDAQRLLNFAFLTGPMYGAIYWNIALDEADPVEVFFV